MSYNQCFAVRNDVRPTLFGLDGEVVAQELQERAKIVRPYQAADAQISERRIGENKARRSGASHQRDRIVAEIALPSAK